jgi:hypothetical protein
MNIAYSLFPPQWSGLLKGLFMNIVSSPNPASQSFTAID